MQAALRLLRKQGLDPVPSAADYGALDPPGVGLGTFFPSSGSLAKVERALHEYLGMLFSKLRGQI